MPEVTESEPGGQQYPGVSIVEPSQQTGGDPISPPPPPSWTGVTEYAANRRGGK